MTRFFLRMARHACSTYCMRKRKRERVENVNRVRWRSERRKVEREGKNSKLGKWN